MQRMWSRPVCLSASLVWLCLFWGLALCQDNGSSQRPAERFLALDTFDDGVPEGKLPQGWEIDVGSMTGLRTCPGKGGEGQCLWIGAGKQDMGLCRFFQPQTGVFTVELDVSPAAPPQGLVCLCVGGDVWVSQFAEWSVCVNYDRQGESAGPFRCHNNGWQETKVIPEESRWYHLRYVIDVPRQCFDLWIDGDCVVSKCAFRCPASELCCLMFFTMARDKEKRDQLLVDNITIYPGTSAPPKGAPVAAAAVPKPPSGAASASSAEGGLTKPGYQLTFHDEFDGDTLNMDLWNFGRTRRDAVKEEGLLKEMYPYELKDGILRLRVEKRRNAAVAKAGELSSYTAKAVATYSAPGIATWDKFAQAYGWFEIRCKMPKAVGIWEGFWLLPLKRGIGAAEIDIFESLTRWNDRISLALHPHWEGGAKYSKGGVRVWGLAEGFHVYAIDWEPERLTYYADGKPVGECTGKGVPSAPLYIIVSCRTGGWAGDYVDEAALPDNFEIDYVRVYRKE